MQYNRNTGYFRRNNTIHILLVAWKDKDTITKKSEVIYQF